MLFNAGCCFFILDSHGYKTPDAVFAGAGAETETKLKHTNTNKLNR